MRRSCLASGPDYLDVPALATLPYTLNVFCYREGTFHVKVGSWAPC